MDPRPWEEKTELAEVRSMSSEEIMAELGFFLKKGKFSDMYKADRKEKGNNSVGLFSADKETVC